MFGLGKKNKDNGSSSVDRLEALKAQLAELKAKEAELDKKTKEKGFEVKKEESVVEDKKPVEVENVLSSQQEKPKQVPSELNDEPPMVVRNSAEVKHYVGNVEGVVLEIGSGMSLNLPIRSRMDIDEFIQIAERVKALNALNFERN